MAAMPLETLSKFAAESAWWMPIAGLGGAMFIVAVISCVVGSIQQRRYENWWNRDRLHGPKGGAS